MPGQYKPGQVTLLHLLLAIALFMPVVAAENVLIHSGGGLFRHLLSVPLGVALGAAVVSVDWKLGSMVWPRTEEYSHRVQNVLGLTLLFGDLLSIVVGAVLGTKLGEFVVQHFAN